MAALTATQLKTKLNTRLRDSDDRTFDDAEKVEAIEQAILDPYVVEIVRTTAATTANTASYARPAGIDKVAWINIDMQGDGFEEPIDQGAWEEVGGNIIFDRTYKGIPAGKTLLIYGEKKLTTSDTFKDNLQPYILELAHIWCLELLKSELATRFLKNDMTMSDLINLINTRERRVIDLRKNLYSNNTPVRG